MSLVSTMEECHFVAMWDLVIYHRTCWERSDDHVGQMPILIGKKERRGHCLMEQQIKSRLFHLSFRSRSDIHHFEIVPYGSARIISQKRGSMYLRNTSMQRASQPGLFSVRWRKFFLGWLSETNAIRAHIAINLTKLTVLPNSLQIDSIYGD